MLAIAYKLAKFELLSLHIEFNFNNLLKILNPDNVGV